jgi:hypothetical protein
VIQTSDGHSGCIGAINMDAHLDELGNHIRRENVVFDHDPESMIRRNGARSTSEDKVIQTSDGHSGRTDLDALGVAVRPSPIPSLSPRSEVTAGQGCEIRVGLVEVVEPLQKVLVLPALRKRRGVFCIRLGLRGQGDTNERWSQWEDGSRRAWCCCAKVESSIRGHGQTQVLVCR